MKVVGYHKRPSYDGSFNYLKLVEMKGYSFHVPICEDEVRELNELGEIGIILAQVTRDTTINFLEAEKLLPHYIKESIEREDKSLVREKLVIRGSCDGLYQGQVEKTDMDDNMIFFTFLTDRPTNNSYLTENEEGIY